jgi:general secretion pathway protein G
MKDRKSGFTLVEILIVVIILGILAAVVIPQFSDASDDTRAASVLTNLKTVRSQLMLYKAQHSEVWPTNFDTMMTSFTDVDGNNNATQTPVFRFGPYVLRTPANPYTGVATVTTVNDIAAVYAAALDLSQGWWYNAATGEFRCHVPDAQVTPSGDQVNAM